MESSRRVESKEEAKPVTTKSELDNRLLITDNNWALSIARLPKTIYSQHAFLIIEGQEESKPVIWFIDLVRDVKGQLDHGQFVPGLQGAAKIRIEHYTSNNHGESKRKRGRDNLLYRCDKRMMDIKPGDQICYQAWGVSKKIATNLIKAAEKDQKDPPKFHLMGKGSLPTWSSSSADGHSCFTWAKAKLKSLGDERLVIEEDFIDKWITSITSRRLPGGPESNYCSFFTNNPKTALALIGGAGIAIAYRLMM